jgi:hypothetical protein
MLVPKELVETLWGRRREKPPTAEGAAGGGVGIVGVEAG